ncbi:MAG: hypothetical protein A3C85_00280 [Candidatus Doudnabacteria bacterium RIFCSPHIGHO2_02_FULL_48_21]|uniref:PDZ domain-containing protein n=1 Tax=Candidatus Doudnabacteria bacterium RIFCSPLOWO2_02_FULL_48_13 TaxID=1817845 RepID=A0A1F5QC40_9BACT|nr:MAG: hypothetical protein A3K05_01375 [Candidatus Doudnabacteria bacterium RIFCSPHIGHO2_01_48_18]OGE77533.1 MAG: hypothetical protein A2668_03570 [Candidatus Doudnabacteria bacterium RIFCSPHIGHO2_01_FULL_48_180]OGE91674.1 MAG: hypothetical protein A3F44_03130 [Candidatus Doudnabacteria bacterium RIFCSPHIGHO2_12_FULL_47_25]OGE93368.1 MAG: hypothetical protein A3C85_00280 [Candidatus Doudnabacteria bacterium RIFCSPHIGHO2_02_FULL_48_21]OGE97452.1 MAG: hypothetical protein A3A83_01215 [Candidatu
MTQTIETNKDLSVLPPEPARKKTEIKHLTTLVALLAGLAGGVLGSIYVAPWYQQEILNQAPGTVTERKQIVVDEQSAIISAVEKVNPSVVSIVITKDLPQFEQFGSPFGGFFFRAPTGETQQQQVGAGSGFIITEDGLIITNKHVVSDTEAEYTVVTKDNQKYPARVIATDPFNDIAVVKIDAKNLSVAIFGDSDKIKLGQRVVAIGNALGEFQNTVTSGVVSGIGRNVTATGGAQSESLSEVIQTDAAINPGNSGGPLADLDGNIIGVNSAVSLQGQLIGFAIPINQVKKVVDDVRQFGKVRRAFLGVRYVIVTESVASAENLSVDYGALIVDDATPGIVPGSPADRAGLREGDIILEVSGERITFDNPLSEIMKKRNPGDRVNLKIQRGSSQLDVAVTLGDAQ